MAEAKAVLGVAVSVSDPVVADERPRRSLDEVIQQQCELMDQLLNSVISSGDTESVHKMRVTTRRLQAALELAEPSPELRLKKARRKLRRWRRSLSRIRNYDVFMTLIDTERGAARSASPEAIDRLRRELQERRQHNYAEAQRQFAKVDIAGFARSIGVPDLLTRSDLVEAESTDLAEQIDDHSVERVEDHTTESTESSQAQIRPAPRTISTEARENSALLLAERAPDHLERRLRQFQSRAALVHESAEQQNAHRLRIAAKRLRYLVEVVSDDSVESPALRWLKSLQDRLGDWHDLAVLEEEILGAVANRKFVTRHLDESIGMLQLASRLRKRREALSSKIFPVRVPRSVAGSTRRLARALRREMTAQKNDSESA